MTESAPPSSRPNRDDLALAIRSWGRELGFQQIGITDDDLSASEPQLLAWLAEGFHGGMRYMARHGTLRSRPAELMPGTRSILCTRMDYLPEPASAMADALADPARAFISRYALGRDYHKTLRNRLKQLARRIEREIGPFAYRVLVDSAPIMEKPLACKAGLGWIGKHTNLIHPRAGSWFFLGEILTDLELTPDRPMRDHCGRCTACIDICPTRAIVAPHRLDARLCISYLTIEHRGSIPEPLRGPIGNRIYGCDDCQTVCPWNRFAHISEERDFSPRARLDRSTLKELFGWNEARFLAITEGSAIRRVGYQAWLRNVAVALGNAPPSRDLLRVLRARLDHPSELVREHVGWAIERQSSGLAAKGYAGILY